MASVERKIGGAGTLHAPIVTANGVRKKQNSKHIANTQESHNVESRNGALTRDQG
jgi:hypothetical protein